MDVSGDAVLARATKRANVIDMIGLPQPLLFPRSPASVHGFRVDFENRLLSWRRAC